jgi:hypothetical protein
LWWPALWMLFWFFVVPLGLGVSIRRGLGERGTGDLQGPGPRAHTRRAD